MSKLSNNQGRANEYAYVITLKKEISKHKKVLILENSSYESAKRAWDLMDVSFQNILLKGAYAGVRAILEFEPLILDDGLDYVKLEIQPDGKGEEGDVRDILISREGISWEIGLSVKHNHFAVKHSRLSPTIDFGEKWFSIKCSPLYWEKVNPIFSFLEKEKTKGTKFEDIASKDKVIYIPILNAFIEEINNSYAKHGAILPKRMVEYLLGKYDFHKTIAIDDKKITLIESFNLRGTLNKQGVKRRTKTILPIANLPSRIISLSFKPKSSNTVELIMDEGWQFSFRIHNAEKIAAPSLKFDIQIISMPRSISMISSAW